LSISRKSIKKTQVSLKSDNNNGYSWFQTFAVFWMLYAFLWVIPRRLNFIFRRFGTLYLFHLRGQVGACNTQIPAYEDGTERVFRNVGIYNLAAGVLPKRKHTTRITGTLHEE